MGWLVWRYTRDQSQVRWAVLTDPTDIPATPSVTGGEIYPVDFDFGYAPLTPGQLYVMRFVDEAPGQGNHYLGSSSPADTYLAGQAILGGVPQSFDLWFTESGLVQVPELASSSFWALLFLVSPHMHRRGGHE